MASSIWNNDTLKIKHNGDTWKLQLHVATTANDKSRVSSPKAKFVTCLKGGLPMAIIPGGRQILVRVKHRTKKARSGNYIVNITGDGCLIAEYGLRKDFKTTSKMIGRTVFEKDRNRAEHDTDANSDVGLLQITFTHATTAGYGPPTPSPRALPRGMSFERSKQHVRLQHQDDPDAPDRTVRVPTVPKYTDCLAPVGDPVVKFVIRYDDLTKARLLAGPKALYKCGYTPADLGIADTSDNPIIVLSEETDELALDWPAQDKLKPAVPTHKQPQEKSVQKEVLGPSCVTDPQTFTMPLSQDDLIHEQNQDRLGQKKLSDWDLLEEEDMLFESSAEEPRSKSSVEDPRVEESGSKLSVEDPRVEESGSELSVEDLRMEEPGSESSVEDPRVEESGSESSVEDLRMEEPGSESSVEDKPISKSKKKKPPVSKLKKKEKSKRKKENGKKPWKPGQKDKPWKPGQKDKPWKPGQKDKPWKPGQKDKPWKPGQEESSQEESSQEDSTCEEEEELELSLVLEKEFEELKKVNELEELEDNKPLKPLKRRPSSPPRGTKPPKRTTLCDDEGLNTGIVYNNTESLSNEQEATQQAEPTRTIIKRLQYLETAIYGVCSSTSIFQRFRALIQELGCDYVHHNCSNMPDVLNMLEAELQTLDSDVAEVEMLAYGRSTNNQLLRQRVATMAVELGCVSEHTLLYEQAVGLLQHMYGRPLTPA